MSVDAELVQQLIRQGDEPLPLFPAPDPRDVKTCEQCGATFMRKKGRARKGFAIRRFCSLSCSTANQTGRTVERAKRCQSDRHEMTAENTIMRDGKPRGCRECSRERDRMRRDNKMGRVARRRSADKPRLRSAKRPVVAAEQPTPVALPPRPVWRPAGFSAAPQVGARQGV